MGSAPPTEAKRALREALRARRAAAVGGEPELDALLAEDAAWRVARCVAGFVAIRGELPVMGALRSALARGVTVALPRVTRAGLVFHRWAGEPLVRSGFGIPEPAPDLPVVPPAALDALLVPGVAFDRAGGRLGQGGGYYDRVLAGPHGHAIGVAWAFQVVDAVPADPWDIPVDAVLTEAGWLFRGPRGGPAGGEGPG